MAQAPFIYLATPCYGGRVYVDFLRSVLALQEACARRGVGLHVVLVGDDALVTRARSRLACAFLADARATHLLFCDADIGFEPDNVFRLLDCGKPVAGGVYPLKQIDWDKARAAAQSGAPDLQAASVGYVVRFIPTPDNSVEVDNGVAKVAYVGTGFLMIARDAVQQVVDAHPELRARLGAGAGETTMIFETMIEPGTGQHLSEDYAFCHRWRTLGGDIWADVESTLSHVGHTVYAGSLVKAMRRG